MDVLRWAAAELGVPMAMVRKVLEADPSLIEGVAAAARGKDVREPNRDPSRTPTKPKSDAVNKAQSGAPEGLLVQLEDPMNRLFVPEARPRVCQIPGSQAVRTTGQFIIEMAQYDIRIYNSNGQQITRIWGDPHVNENGGGDNWHFGNNSTFVLTDGTKICLDTEQNASGEWLVEGIDIIAGQDRYHFGTGGKDGLTKDGQAWDKENADVAAGDDSAGLFALKPDGTWAMQGKDGHFYDVKDESWGDYQSSGDVNYDQSKPYQPNELQQHAVLFDHLPAHVEDPRGGTWNQGPDQNTDYKSMKLQVPKKRPKFLKHKTSSCVQSPMGYTVEVQGTEVIIWDFAGKQITRIWGDPHVNEGKGGDNWHFGGNSTFILPDGTKVRCDTEPIATDFWVVVAVDVTLGSSRFHYTKKGGASMHDDGREFDKSTTDADNRGDAGIFALAPNGEWAIMGRDGRFYDIVDESWAEYKKDPDVDLRTGKEVKLTTQQLYAAYSDQFPEELMMPAFTSRSGDAEWSEDERRQKLDALRRVVPVSHLKAIKEQLPGLIAALAEDLVMAQHVANMDLKTLQRLLQFAPGLIVNNPHKAPPRGAEWPVTGVTGRRAKRPEPWWRG